MQKFHIGANYLLKVISGKWKVSIICALSLKNYRYLELLKYENSVNNTRISKKVLTEQLNQLEKDGIVIKKQYNVVPPKTIYSLSTIGKKLSQNLLELNFIGEEISRKNSKKILFDITANDVKKLHEESGDF